LKKQIGITYIHTFLAKINPSMPWLMLQLLPILFLAKIKPINDLNGAAFS